MNKWDSRFIAMAEHIASWSKDPSTKVGAVIADQKNRIVSVGYNGLPHGVDDNNERLKDRDIKLAMTIHAEENAILFAGRDVAGMTIYVHPLFPCSNCAAKIIQSGISRVVSRHVKIESKWFESIKKSREMFGEAGVSMNFIDSGYNKTEAEIVMESVQKSWSERNMPGTERYENGNM